MLKDKVNMNPKIVVGVAVAALAIIIGIVGFSGSTIINDISEGGLLSPSETPREILPLEIELEDISILEVSEKFATLEISFKTTNPNFKSILLQNIKYEIYENDKKIHTGQIGERLEGGMVIGSNYFTILSETSVTLSDKITIKNTGNTPELWSALKNNTPDWKIKGEAHFNLSSMTTGGENEIFFEFP